MTSREDEAIVYRVRQVRAACRNAEMQQCFSTSCTSSAGRLRSMLFVCRGRLVTPEEGVLCFVVAGLGSCLFPSSGLKGFSPSKQLLV